jgi:hypothetical protein
MQIMVGRPRKTGKREPNGRIARVYVNPKSQVASQPHRVGVPREYREWPEAGSEFGRMMLRKIITPAQYEAGMLFAGLSVAFCAVYDIPSPHPHAMDLTRVGVSLGREMAPEKAIEIKKRYNRAFDACGEAGRKAQMAVKNCAVLDRKIDSFEMRDRLRAGLDKLIVHFHINPQLELDRESRITDRH